jgi:hypothetical protein
MFGNMSQRKTLNIWAGFVFGRQRYDETDGWHPVVLCVLTNSTYTHSNTTFY